MAELSIAIADDNKMCIRDRYIHVNSSLSLQPPLQRGGFSGWKIHAVILTAYFLRRLI